MTASSSSGPAFADFLSRQEGKAPIGLITGASSGIGEAFARALAPHCGSLILVARREQRLQQLAEALRQQGCEVHIVAADLRTTEGLTRIVETIRQKGPVSILVNNAGLGTQGAFDSVDFDAQMAMVDVHISATMRLSRAVIPFMKQLGGGHIINVSSVAALVPMGSVAVYCASKAFLNSFSQALNDELQGEGIRVQALCPGYVRTEFHNAELAEGFNVDQIPDQYWLPAETVVEQSLAALNAESPITIAASEDLKAALNLA